MILRSVFTIRVCFAFYVLCQNHDFNNFSDNYNDSYSSSNDNNNDNENNNNYNNNSDNLFFDIRFVENWVPPAFYVWFFSSNNSDYEFKKYIWLDVFFYFFS
jgi:hypothetical protein